MSKIVLMYLNNITSCIYGMDPSLRFPRFALDRLDRLDRLDDQFETVYRPCLKFYELRILVI